MNFSQRIELARRIFGGHRTRFLSFTYAIAIGSVALSSAALLIALAVLEGFEHELERKVGLFVAHVDAQILRSDTRTSPSQWIQTLWEINPAIERVTAYTEFEAVLVHRGNVEAAIVHSDTPAVTERITALHLGNWHRTGNTLAIGRPLAERLGVRAGDSVVLLLAGAGTGRTSTLPTTVRMPVGAIYESGMWQLDESIVLAPWSLMSRLSGGMFMPTGLGIWSSDIHSSDAIAHQLDSLFGRTLYIRVYRDRFPAMFTWIAMQKRPIPIIIGILSIVAAFNVLTLLFVALVERRNAIATLRVLGLSRSDLISMIALYGIWSGVIGYGIGAIIAGTFSWAQHTFGLIRLDGTVYFLDRLPIEPHWQHAALVASIVVVLTVAVTTIPAYAATRISPLSILRIK
jgi:lipoprotein-releasing system permease protein